MSTTGGGARLAPGGLVLVDKPSGLTSHDVVSRMRRIAGTRRVGHAGTLDPMATGVLVVGVERATKLLGHLALTTKTYAATIRLGSSTVTDDAQGVVTASTDASGVSTEAVGLGIAALTGQIRQVPSSVSAIKVDGRRSYLRVAAGEPVELPARPVSVTRFELVALRRHGTLLDLDVEVDCSTGTYIRALARDLGAGLAVGGHLTTLRRTRVGTFTVDRARGLEDLAADSSTGRIGLDDAVSECFARVDLDAESARSVAHGGKLPAAGIVGAYGVFGPDGQVVALMVDEGDRARSLVVLTPAGS